MAVKIDTQQMAEDLYNDISNYGTTRTITEDMVADAFDGYYYDQIIASLYKEILKIHNQ